MVLLHVLKDAREAAAQPEHPFPPKQPVPFDRRSPRVAAAESSRGPLSARIQKIQLAQKERPAERRRAPQSARMRWENRNARAPGVPADERPESSRDKPAVDKPTWDSSTNADRKRSPLDREEATTGNAGAGAGIGHAKARMRSLGRASILHARMSVDSKAAAASSAAAAPTDAPPVVRHATSGSLAVSGGMRAGLVSLSVSPGPKEGTITAAQFEKDVQGLRTRLLKMTARYMAEINESPPPGPRQPPAPAPLEVEVEHATGRGSPSMRGLATALPQLHTARSMRIRGEGGGGPKKSRGAYGHPPLRSELPPRAMARIPPRITAAADAFDKGHQRRWDQAEGLMMAISRDPTHEAKAVALSGATEELFRGRYAERIELEGLKRFARREKRKEAPKGRIWKLSESIWAPRVKWSDSKGFWDNEETDMKMFRCDWRRALACGLAKHIVRLDDEAMDLNNDGVDDEVEEVADVLWEFHELLYCVFDYYGAMGASNDFTHITPNAFADFVNDCRLPDRRSKACKSADFDRLFIAVDAASAKAQERHNRKKALNRQEFLQ